MFSIDDIKLKHVSFYKDFTLKTYSKNDILNKTKNNVVL